MKIRKITLENVKSYESEVIEFHDGINVIAGRNGAGKTTLIEAIGFALFGYMNKDYSYQDFISHGAASGKIAVEFEVDGSFYRIERSFHLRGTKSWTIADLGTDEIIETHTVEDVNFVLASILGMKEEISLAELFERIIGVSQGTFTEPFLRSPAGRKEYFERIFMLDSYKVAYQKSSEPAAILRSQCDELEKELIKLRTRVEDYGILKTQQKEEEERLALVQANQKALEEELNQVKTDMQAMKVSKELIQTLETQIVQYSEQAAQFKERLAAANDEIRISEKAAELVLAYTETHRVYQEIKNRITQLETNLETQEGLEKQKNTLEKEVAVLTERLQTRQESLLENREKLENERKARLEETEECLLPLAGIDRELKLVTEELDKIAKAAAEHTGVSGGIQTFERLYSQLSDRLQEWNTLAQEIADINQRLNVPELEEAVQAIPAVQAAVDAKNHALAALETRIESEREHIAEVGDGLCPLLKRECKTLQGENLKEYFLRRVGDLEAERAEEEAQKILLTRQLMELREQEKRLAALQILFQERDARLLKLQLLESKSTETSRAMHEKLQNIYTGLLALKKAGYLNSAGSLIFKEMLPVELPEEVRRMQMELDILQNHLHWSQGELTCRETFFRQKKEDLIDRRNQFAARLDQLQRRQKEIETSLQELVVVEAELAKESHTLQRDRIAIAELVDKLQTFGDVKSDLKKAREELVDLEEGNQIYLTYRQKAEELGTLQEQEKRLTAALEEVEQGQQQTEQKLTVERQKFDSEVLGGLEVRAEELTRETSQAQTLIHEGERRLKELAQKLKEMEQTRSAIKEREADLTRVKKALDLMNFIRNIYNTSAEEIAQVFLQFISHEATNIYRQLSGENVQLVWEKDYQVRLKDKHRTRLFKQLSGGEQMSAAFAIRLALLRKFSTVRLGFFDEPTTHLDEYRRTNIAQAIASIREKGDDYFEQIFVISHDDTFTTLTENLIRIDKSDKGASYILP